MPRNFKNIYIGKLIEQRMKECDISLERAAKFLKLEEDEVEQMYEAKSLNCDILLRWSKLLEYDFFRIYCQHLILYAPQYVSKTKRKKSKETKLPVFKKNIYTQEVILYLVELVEDGKKTCRQIQKEYNIPGTTILRWANKYGKKQIEEL